MASSWIVTRTTKRGERRYRVEYRLGGRESATRYGGSFKRKADAEARKRWISRELAERRAPDLRTFSPLPAVPTLREAAERWKASRVDVSEGTRVFHRVSLDRLLPHLGDQRLDELAVADLNEAIARLSAAGRKPATIRKSIQTLATLLSDSGVEPNVARDRRLRFPHERRAEIKPPTGEHVLAAHALLPTRYRLPLLVLDATGMRVGELESLTWGDVDEPRSRWRVSQAASKTRRARWVQVPPAVFAAVLRLVPREDRTVERPVFQGFGADRFRTAITRACRAAGVPTFSPHDLRHRRISLLHLAGVPWARIGEHVGQRDLAVTANTYTHVLADEVELDYAALLIEGSEPR
jgi:integrase